MKQNSYLVRRGARYHFRRRLPCQFEVKRPISISLGTSDPAEARRLVNRLAARWDDLVMLMLPKLERGHLTLEEQEVLFRQGLKDELARATAHLTAPIGSIAAHQAPHKILEAAFRIVARVPHSADAICADVVEAEINDSWSGAEVELLWKTLALWVRPMSVSRTDALEALEKLDAPLNEGTIGEARQQVLRGHAEAHRRAALIGSPEVTASGRGVMALLDDAMVGQVSAADRSCWQPAQMALQTNEPEQASRISSPYAYESIYVKPCDLKFSEIIEPVLGALSDKRGWKKDYGQRLAVCERAAWICGDKPLRDWSAADAEYFATTMAKFPNNFQWGKLNVSGAMAEPFAESLIPPITAGKKRSPRTINRDLSILQNVSKRLSKTHWKLKYGDRLEVDFLEHSLKIVEDRENPPRMPWTPEHLRALYGLPLWQGSGGAIARLKTPASKKVWMDAAYWLPFFGTYGGICREEGSGFAVEDFNFDCEVPYVIVRPNAMRGLKTASRGRVMPLHPELLRLGLESYVEAIAA